MSKLKSPYNATLALQVRQARASGENLNYMTLAPQARQARPSGENFELLVEFLVLYPIVRSLGW